MNPISTRSKNLPTQVLIERLQKEIKKILEKMEVTKFGRFSPAIHLGWIVDGKRSHLWQLTETWTTNDLIVRTVVRKSAGNPPKKMEMTSPFPNVPPFNKEMSKCKDSTVTKDFPEKNCVKSRTGTLQTSSIQSSASFLVFWPKTSCPKKTNAVLLRTSLCPAGVQLPPFGRSSFPLVFGCPHSEGKGLGDQHFKIQVGHPGKAVVQPPLQGTLVGTFISMYHDVSNPWVNLLNSLCLVIFVLRLFS